MNDLSTDSVILNKIRQIDLFSAFIQDDDRIIRLARNLELESYRVGEKIISENEVTVKFYILFQGSVRIIKHTISHEEHAVANFNAEDNVYFGELSLTGNDKRTATICAVTDCSLLSINREDFLKICEEDHTFGYEVFKQILKKMSKTIQRMNNDVILLFQALIDEIKGEL